MPAPCVALHVLLLLLSRSRPRRHLQLERQATLHRDISRCVASFRFELREDGRPELPPQAHPWCLQALSEAEFLLALCTSDFVIRGTIHGVAHDTELQESVITVAAACVLRQTLPLFQVEGPGGQVQASICTPLSCGVHPGPGPFLFMGWSHLGEAWLGCAPRIQEFSRACAAARVNHLYP